MDKSVCSCSLTSPVPGLDEGFRDCAGVRGTLEAWEAPLLSRALQDLG